MAALNSQLALTYREQVGGGVNSIFPQRSIKCVCFFLLLFLLFPLRVVSALVSDCHSEEMVVALCSCPLSEHVSPLKS